MRLIDLLDGLEDTGVKEGSSVCRGFAFGIRRSEADLVGDKVGRLITSCRTLVVIASCGSDALLWSVTEIRLILGCANGLKKS